MHESGSDRERWEDLLAAELIRKIQEIPIVERLKRLLPPFVYARELAAEHPASGDAVNPEHARRVVDEHAVANLFRDMFDPKHPLSTAWVLNQATGIGLEHLSKKRSVYWKYCGELPAPNDALGYAFDALLALSACIDDPDPAREEVRKPYGWLWKWITRSINADIHYTVIKHREPWRQKRYRLVLKFRKQLELENPSMDSYEIEEEALRLADEEMKDLVQLLVRGDFEEAERLASEIDFSDLVHSKLMFDLIEGRLKQPPFTEIDRDTWSRWRAVDFVGRDIDWPGAGVKASTGAQRLHALIRKLPGLDDDLGYGA